MPVPDGTGIPKYMKVEVMRWHLGTIQAVYAIPIAFSTDVDSPDPAILETARSTFYRK
tara:strand:- start:446 stop:619 length:174 start_codon:yes stop_codon:yes gene_type:complete